MSMAIKRWLASASSPAIARILLGPQRRETEGQRDLASDRR
jgi:hypothetical protein